MISKQHYNQEFDAYRRLVSKLQHHRELLYHCTKATPFAYRMERAQNTGISSENRSGPKRVNDDFKYSGISSENRSGPKISGISSENRFDPMFPPSVHMERRVQNGGSCSTYLVNKRPRTRKVITQDVRI